VEKIGRSATRLYVGTSPGSPARGRERGGKPVYPFTARKWIEKKKWFPSERVAKEEGTAMCVVGFSLERNFQGGGDFLSLQKGKSPPEGGGGERKPTSIKCSKKGRDLFF